MDRLRLGLLQQLKGVHRLVIYDEGIGGKNCAEIFDFDARGLVRESHAHDE